MSGIVTHEGFTQFELSSEVQKELDAADTLLLESDPTTSNHLKKIEHEAELYAGPWGPQQEEAATKVVSELLIEEISTIEKWPGSRNPKKIGYRGKDVVLQKDILVTPAEKRNLLIPRPYGAQEKVKAVVWDKHAETRQVVKWETSYAYMLEAGVSIIPFGKPIRMFLLSLRRKESGMGEGGKATEDDTQAGEES